MKLLLPVWSRVGGAVACGALFAMAACGGAPPSPRLRPTPSARTVPSAEEPVRELDWPLAAPSASTVRFSEAPPLRMRRGAALKLVPIAKETSIIALSPDGRSWVIEGPKRTVRLVTPTLPAGVERPGWVSSGLFSEDGSRLLLWNAGAGLDVLDVATGRSLVNREGQVCGARFRSRDEVVAIVDDPRVDTQKPDARAWHIDLRNGQALAVSKPFPAERCLGSLDGRYWLVDSYDGRTFLDGTTGQTRPLAKGFASADLSRAGNRICVGDETGLRCLRLPEQRVELVWTRPSASTSFDVSGTTALISYVNSPDGVYNGLARVDFEAATVTPLPDVRQSSGSTFDLGPGGVLLTIGSSSGLSVYDLERGELRFAAHRPLYGNFSFPYAPRLIVAGTDEPMDLFRVEVR